MTGIKELAAKLRNIFCISDFQKRDNDTGAVQIKTHNNKVLEKAEAWPYGFYAKAAGGRAIVFCQGGNYDGFEILPVLKSDDVELPELEEGDAALYTAEGGVIIARNGGGIDVTAKGEGDITIKTDKGTALIKADGKIYLGNDQIDNCALITGLIDEIKGLVTAGSPASQTINPASQQKLEVYKNQVKKLYAEGE